MRTSLRGMLFLSVIMLGIAQQNAAAQTITSTVTGGRWNSGGAWIGGVVPSSGSDVVIAGTVAFENGDGSCRNLTVNAGGTLNNTTDYYANERILIVNGNVTNNGSIASYGNQPLVLRVKGNITNNGTWTPRRVELNGTGTQTLTAGAANRYSCVITVDTTSKPSVAAGSNLTFTSTVDLGKRTLDMKSFSLTFVGEGTLLTNGTVLSAKDITGLPGYNQYGTANYSAMYNVTYSGAVNIRGRIQINHTVTFIGNTTITDTIESISDYYSNERLLKITGNLTNNGIIRWGGRNPMALNVSGDITNNGKWIHNRTDLSGTGNQVITLGPGKRFESPFRVTDSLGMIVAASDVVFTGSFNLNKTVMDMKNYSITLVSEAAGFTNGIVINTRDIIGSPGYNIYGTPNYPMMNNITYDGAIYLKGRLQINTLVTMRGSVTVVDTVESISEYYSNPRTLAVVGNITNNGIMRYTGRNPFIVSVTGNLLANKPITNQGVQLAGTGNRTIVDRLSTAPYSSIGEKVVLVGDNYLPNLTVAANSKCLLANGATIFTANGTLDPALDNWSCITTTRKFTGIADYSFFKSRIKVLPNVAIDSVRILSYGHQVPSTYAGAVKCYWRVRTFASNPRQSFSSMTFLYDDVLLGTNTESALQVYQSQDSGMTWKQVSTTANLTRDLNGNSITLADAPGFGDYVISSTADPSSVRPSIVVSISGRNQIRIGGAPNRYTINYYNNSDSPTLDFLLPVMTEKFVHIKSAEITQLDGRKDIFPADSICYDGDDSSAVFWVAPMNPREARAFDIILTSDSPPVSKLSGASPLRLGKDSEILIEPLTTAAAAAVTYVVTKYGAKIVASGIDYLGKKAEEATTLPPDKMDKAKIIFANTGDIYLPQAKKENIGSEPVKKVGEKLSKILITKAMNITGGAYDIAASTIGAVKRVVPNLRARLWVWLMDDVGYFGVTETTDVEISSKSLKKTNPVRSFDPNEKVGPTGFGTQNYITSAGKMNYRILFENKKEATAPAWKITIVDTLRAEFDPESFEFGATSHDSAQYVWKKTRTGNMVRWEIEGIDLPPNVTPPQGEGWVAFSVNAKPNLTSGTTIKNRATIVFDMNAPIATNEFVNTLDFSPPKTTMKGIPTRMTASRLVVRWSGADDLNGSGVESYTVYAAKDSGTYQAIGSTTADSMVVNLDMYTHKYSFYALSKDNVGNVETARPTPISSDITNGVGESDRVTPVEFALDQNYPNPFNPSTTIAYTLASEVRASLKIYDVLGREVAGLLDEEQTPGKHSVIWDATRLSSGIYFYRLTAGDFIQTRKLVLLK
ncbi:MAG: T9SS type A sorting domain-containing protein [Ignavibacteriales bacterium]|nr:T9SS type A sorting domain-containing protein [Ignavibacteriales bacterium]